MKAVEPKVSALEGATGNLLGSMSFARSENEERKKEIAGVKQKQEQLEEKQEQLEEKTKLMSSRMAHLFSDSESDGVPTPQPAAGPSQSDTPEFLTEASTSLFGNGKAVRGKGPTDVTNLML